MDVHTSPTDLLPLPDPAGPEPVVAVLVEQQWAAFEVGIATEVFGIRRGEVLRHPGVDRWYDLRMCGTGEPIQGPGGVDITVQHGLDTLAAADIVIVPFCAKRPEAERVPLGHGDPLPVGAHTVDALRAAAENGATMLSFCSGAFALAQAGLLDGRDATTHWMYAQTFRRRFPKVRFQTDVLYVDEGQMLTSAGSASGIDLSLHLIRKRHGADVADLIARRMVVPPHRDGGQAQYVERPVPPRPGDGIADVVDWLADNLDRELTVADMARHAHLSPRTFARRFRAATGTTPHRWLLDRRVDHAERLLEGTDLTVGAIARRVGLGSADTLRHAFAARRGTTPSAHRRAFGRR